jgi:hypothetical protein
MTAPPSGGDPRSAVAVGSRRLTIGLEDLRARVVAVARGWRI